MLKQVESIVNCLQIVEELFLLSVSCLQIEEELFLLSVSCLQIEEELFFVLVVIDQNVLCISLSYVFVY